MKTHVASVKTNNGVRLGGSVVHQHLGLFDGVSGRRSLLRSDFVERNEHGGIDGARDVEEGAGDALHAFDTVFLKRRCCCGFGRVLDFGTIRRCEPFVGRILGAFRSGVLEAFQCVGDGVWHGDVDVVFWVVPPNGQSAVLAAGSVDGNGIMILEGIDEVGGVVGGEEFDAKVIYSKSEGGG